MKRGFFTFGAVIASALATLLFCPMTLAQSKGVIKVYDEDGKVEKAYNFKYTPVKTKYTPSPQPNQVIKSPSSKAKSNATPPEPQSSAYYVQPNAVDKSTGNKNASRKKSSKWKSRKVKKIQNKTIGDQHVTVVTRKLEDKKERKYIEEEIIVDAARKSNSIGSRMRSKRNPPKSGKVKIRRRIK